MELQRSAPVTAALLPPARLSGEVSPLTFVPSPALALPLTPPSAPIIPAAFKKGAMPVCIASSAATLSKNSFLTFREFADSGLLRLASDWMRCAPVVLACLDSLLLAEFQ